MDTSQHYKIHPIVVGTKAFDKGMMTYQHEYGKPYTIPIYCWYLEGSDKKILVDTGEYAPLQSKERETAIGGKIYTFEEGLNRWGLKPEDIDIVIHTHLHNDHCENDDKCKNAVFYVHEKELEQISMALDRDPRLKATIEQLETLYEARAKRRKEEEMPQLSPEVERFLMEMDRRFREG